MGKNAHPPRGGNKAAKKPSTTINGEDSSYIVFSNAKDEPQKSSGGGPPSAAAGKSKSKASKDAAAAAQPGTEDAPKKPDTRALIGGASWTGKLPVNMLSEHCQKQKWEKPEYTMVLWGVHSWLVDRS